MPTQVAVAARSRPGKIFYGTYFKGEHVRVFTIQSSTPDYAISFIQSLSTVANSLHSLELWLAVAAASGIAVATGASLLLARSAMRSVRRLTAAVEHVARTAHGVPDTTRTRTRASRGWSRPTTAARRRAAVPRVHRTACRLPVHRHRISTP
jgi:hypothetical protein